MTYRSLLPILCLLCSPVPAQEPTAAKPAEADMMMGGAPQPGAEHKVLERFAGNWDVSMKMWMQPGAEPVTSTAADETKVVCNGFWILSKVSGPFQGQPFHGRAMMGYDPQAKKYRSVWVDSMGPWAAESTGTWDEASTTFTWNGEGTSPEGKKMTLRGVLKYTDDDSRVETIYMPGPDGKEFVHMEMSGKRSTKAGSVEDASAGSGAAALGEEHKQLAKSAGTWDADFRMEMGGMPPMQSKCTETNTVICNGLWLQGEFRGDMMGMPFEGRSITGYDAGKKKYVSWWFDSMSPTCSHSTGTYDAASKALVMNGRSIGMDGKPVSTVETMKWTGADERTFTMISKSEDGAEAGKMTIVYKRAKK